MVPSRRVWKGGQGENRREESVGESDRKKKNQSIGGYTPPPIFYFIDCGIEADTVVHTSTFTATEWYKQISCAAAGASLKHGSGGQDFYTSVCVRKIKWRAQCSASTNTRASARMKGAVMTAHRGKEEKSIHHHLYSPSPTPMFWFCFWIHMGCVKRQPLLFTPFTVPNISSVHLLSCSYYTLCLCAVKLLSKMKQWTGVRANVPCWTIS